MQTLQKQSQINPIKPNFKTGTYAALRSVAQGRLDGLDEQLADKNIAQVAAELENKEQSQIVWNAVRTLPSNWSIAILLFYRENKSIMEISKIMKKRENTIKTYLFRGRKRLKALLADHIGDYENGSRQISQCG